MTIQEGFRDFGKYFELPKEVLDSKIEGMSPNGRAALVEKARECFKKISENPGKSQEIKKAYLDEFRVIFGLSYKDDRIIAKVGRLGKYAVGAGYSQNKARMELANLGLEFKKLPKK